MTDSPWILIGWLSFKGLRLFRHADGGLAVADNSGKTPDDTEDGPLWLPTYDGYDGAPVDCDWGGVGHYVLCLNGKGKLCRTPTTVGGAAWLTAQWRECWKFAVRAPTAPAASVGDTTP